jgi:transposase
MNGTGIAIITCSQRCYVPGCTAARPPAKWRYCISAPVRAQAALQADLMLLTSVVGIGALTAAKELAEMPDLAQYAAAKAAAADTGVRPSHVESGMSVRRRPRMSKLGKAQMGAAL